MFSVPTVYGKTSTERNAVRDAGLAQRLEEASRALQSAVEHVETMRRAIADEAEWGSEVDMGTMIGRAEYIARESSEVARRYRDTQDALLAATSLSAGYEITEA